MTFGCLVLGGAWTIRSATSVSRNDNSWLRPSVRPCESGPLIISRGRIYVSVDIACNLAWALVYELQPARWTLTHWLAYSEYVISNNFTVTHRRIDVICKHWYRECAIKMEESHVSPLIFPELIFGSNESFFSRRCLYWIYNTVDSYSFSFTSVPHRSERRACPYSKHSLSMVVFPERVICWPTDALCGLPRDSRLPPRNCQTSLGSKLQYIKSAQAIAVVVPVVHVTSDSATVQRLHSDSRKLPGCRES